MRPIAGGLRLRHPSSRCPLGKMGRTPRAPDTTASSQPHTLRRPAADPKRRRGAPDRSAGGLRWMTGGRQLDERQLETGRRRFRDAQRAAMVGARRGDRARGRGLRPRLGRRPDDDDGPADGPADGPRRRPGLRGGASGPRGGTPRPRGGASGLRGGAPGPRGGASGHGQRAELREPSRPRGAPRGRRAPLEDHASPGGRARAGDALPHPSARAAQQPAVRADRAGARDGAPAGRCQRGGKPPPLVLPSPLRPSAAAPPRGAAARDGAGRCCPC